MVTIEKVKELRDRTGVGMSKCKQALAEANGDMDKAIEGLRKAGLASAAKKEARATNEGMIAFAESEAAFALVEVNAETDFVVRNDDFKAFTQALAKQAAEEVPENLEMFMASPSRQGEGTVDENRVQIVQKIGENIQVSRLRILKKEANRSTGVYSHAGGKIVTAVELDGASDQQDFAREIAMHVAAQRPEFLSPEKVSEDVVARERDIARAQVQGKPEEIVEKILDGKMQAYYKDNCLLNQSYIKEEKKSVEQIVKERGASLAVTDFLFWQVGQ